MKCVQPAAGILLLSMIAACDPVLSPDDVAGEYVLQGTPVVLEHGGGRLEILADTLRLRSDGTATRALAESYDSEAGSHVSERVDPYVYRIRRGRVELEFICPINALALCVAPPHLWGPPTATGLELRYFVDPHTALRYERTAPGVRAR